ncbi:hypothetical protein [Ruegeria arenilitoris]|uniref:hypothetical protein n=1 Tax=Ruegeria arenilitoris TaxID=1173585 RepID=UPI00147DC628|nr:hypothetical protein [Ruegeria arenilitoris]
MKMFVSALSLTLVAGAVHAQAISSRDVCKKAGTENRLNGMSSDQCLCLAGIAQQAMSPELYVLWTEAMYFGESREKEMLGLIQSQRKTLNQMKKTKRLSQKQCGIS